MFYNRKFNCFTKNLLTRETTIVKKPNIYHVAEDNRLSPGLQLFFFRFVIVFTLPEIILLSTTKLKSSLKHL